MNQRQSKFIIEYLKTGNATESAINAGYSKKTAYSTGQRMLKYVEIKKILSKHREQISKDAELTVSEVVKEIMKLAYHAKTETNKLRALEMLMKHLGGFIDIVKIIENLSDEQVDKVCDTMIKKLDK